VDKSRRVNFFWFDGPRGAGSATDRHAVIPLIAMPRTLTIDGRNEPARVVFTWPVWPEGADIPYLGVRLEYKTMVASWDIDCQHDRSAFIELFRAVDTHRDRIPDALSIESEHSELTIVADDIYSWPGDVALVFELSCDSQDPYWTAKLRVHVPKENLKELAANAAAFFESVGAG